MRAVPIYIESMKVVSGAQVFPTQLHFAILTDNGFQIMRRQAQFIKWSAFNPVCPVNGSVIPIA